MTNLIIIENKISSVQKYLRILDNYKKHSRKKIEEDLSVRGAVERYLYLAAQATIDLAEAVIACKNFRKPATLSENFHILNEEKIISSQLTAKMVSLAGFRNIIAHDYKKIDYDIVYDILKNRLKDIEDFLATVKKSLSL